MNEFKLVKFPYFTKRKSIPLALASYYVFDLVKKFSRQATPAHSCSGSKGLVNELFLFLHAYFTYVKLARKRSFLNFEEFIIVHLVFPG